MPIQEKCRILENREVGSQHFRLTLTSPYISSHARPGQFVQVKVSEDNSPLLRRPFSLHLFSEKHKTISLLYHIIGKGTEKLSRVSVGSELDVIGPLGEGFNFSPKKNIAVLVGGGIGVAPLLALAETIRASRQKTALYILAGFKGKSHVICEEELKKSADEMVIATDDGSYGKKGLVSDLLLGLVNDQLPANDFQVTNIYACGPRPMLRAVSEIAFQKKIDCQLSMEERMACGIGACKGCAIQTRSGYKMVCKDGPVFPSEEIIW